MLTEYDQYHLLLMRESIAQFEKTAPTLASLLSLTRSLKELLNALRDIHTEWKEAFRMEWWELEFTSSLMVDQEINVVSQEDKEALDEALHHMKQMVEEILEKN